MQRLKTYNATGVAPDGRLYAGDLNALEDAVAALDDDTQTIKLNALTIHDDDIQLVKYGSAEARISAALRVDNILRGLGGIIAGAFTTTQRNAIVSPPYGLVILNTTANRYEFNAGSSGSPSWAPLNSATGIVNADIAAGAAIAYSKLNLAGSVVNADVAGAAAIAYSKLNLAGSILNADVNAAAAIAYSKLALSNSIVNADVATAAAIARSKLNFGSGLVDADIASAAAIAYSKLALTGNIVNADIKSTAAIAISKLASYPSDASKVLKGDGSWGVLTKAFSSGGLGSYALPTDNYAGGGSGMLGMGLSITPSSSGKISVVIASSAAGGWTNVAATFAAYIGTGGAPANQAAITGTAISTALEQTGFIGAGYNPCCVVGSITGLTPGTTYWVDIGMVFVGLPQGGQNPGLYGGSYILTEVG